MTSMVLIDTANPIYRFSMNSYTDKVTQSLYIRFTDACPYCNEQKLACIILVTGVKIA